MKVNYAANNDDGAAAKIARESDVAIVCVGNHPNGGFDTVWAKVSTPSEGREAVDRQSIILEQEELIKAVFQANPKTIADVQAGKTQAVGALIGQAKKLNPNVDPARVREICLQLIQGTI